MKTKCLENKLSNSNETKTLGFLHVSQQEVKNKILNLSSKKSTRKGNILAKVLKDNINVNSKELTAIIKSCLEKGLFPDDLKIADVSTITDGIKIHTWHKYHTNTHTNITHGIKIFALFIWFQKQS